jgi:hypothetical protein
MEENNMKMNIKAMALTIAIVWGVGLFMITWWIILLDGASTAPNFLSKFYRGYSITPLGSIIGFAWAFTDGAFGGACIAWIYNKLAVNDKND